MGKKTEIGKMEAVIEAILFTMGESVELKKIAAAIEQDVYKRQTLARTLEQESRIHRIQQKIQIM